MDKELEKIINESVEQDAAKIKNKYNNIKMDAEIKDKDGIVLKLTGTSSEDVAFQSTLFGIMSLFTSDSKFRLVFDPVKKEIKIPLDFQKLLRTVRR